MTPKDIDGILSQAAASGHRVDPAVLQRIKGPLQSSLAPVKPLARPSFYVASLFAAFVLVSVSLAGMLGFAGFHALSTIDRIVIYGLLGATAFLSASAVAGEMTPQGGRRLGGWALAASTILFVAVFAVLFRNKGFQGFVPQGIPCLRAGLITAVPEALLIFLIARRGFSAGSVAIGTLAGLTGLTMLELHCPNLNAVHVLAWHVGVLLISGIAGWLAGKIHRVPAAIR